MNDELLAMADGILMGRIYRHRTRDLLSFHYENAWASDRDSFALSLSMPLTRPVHDDPAVEPFLWGLLPDNDGVLKRWGERFHVSAGNAFKLLCHVGEECAGAVQLIRPEMADGVQKKSSKGSVQWLGDDEITLRIRDLVNDHSATRTARDRGQFSLAGAQPKTAFHLDAKTGRWGVPSGSVPTTHIFKPATGDFDGYTENEHFCLSLARELGLAAASSTVRVYGDIPVIIVERYDRRRDGTAVKRIHQEDMCQALMRMPHIKYQNQGGPSAVDIMQVIRTHSSAQQSDTDRFLDALIFNWLIAGTDAHAKNYSLLLGSKGIVRLAPLYDLASSLPYPRQVLPRKAKLAMKIGGQYTLYRIGLREWQKAAVELKMQPDRVITRIREWCQSVPDAARSVAKEMRAGGLRHSVIKRLVDGLTERATACAKMVA